MTTTSPKQDSGVPASMVPLTCSWCGAQEILHSLNHFLETRVPNSIQKILIFLRAEACTAYL